MEAISNMATDAARAVWGDSTHGKEPISGAQGNVPRGEPFDAGNLSDAAQQERLDRTVGNPSSTHPASTQNERLDDDASSPNYRHDSGMLFSGGNGQEQFDKTPETPLHKPSHSSTGDQGLDATAASSNRTRHGAENHSLPTDREGQAVIGPSEQTSHNSKEESLGGAGVAASSGKLPGDVEKETSASDKVAASSDRLPGDAEKETSPSDYAKEKSSKKKDSGVGEAEGDPETSVMGEGPKSLADVAKDNGGDAGNSGDAAKKDADNSTSEAGGSDGKEKNNETKGTGEQYVRTTGLAADGGDFDATKPGAGKEADRLMEEKGMSHEGGDNKGGKKTGGGDGDKPSLGERIKNKLHKH
ncbi:hypothetical protein HRG_008692 [Hirsutella rhossiliensis]|uniref:Glycine-rich cell wall structural protein 1 n=1 Tax=Hirsutella rhossiliensis TaxID=111463 RepID=A0A9P8MWN4_9HYPO|nr:uncharacterized protein HRG_08692 [Hirsutella rhossiliensis]KAH0960537.1 hypothetical protein HRG_08692 [Hirsutella rhossiliensis]